MSWLLCLLWKWFGCQINVLGHDEIVSDTIEYAEFVLIVKHLDMNFRNYVYMALGLTGT